MRLGQNIESVYSEGKEIQRVYSKGKLVWEKGEIDYSVIPFTVKCVKYRSTIYIRGENDEIINFKYSFNGGEWYDADSSEEIELRENSRISIIATGVRGCYIWGVHKGWCDVYGNLLSLIHGSGFSEYVDAPYTLEGFFTRDDAVLGSEVSLGSDIRSAKKLILPLPKGDKCFRYMFQNCDRLIEPPELPATELPQYCYEGMFFHCDSLTTAPTKLPATTLSPYCYKNMFYGCISLTTAPELPATTLSPYCYSWMFMHCDSLTTAPELPATELAILCYEWMFYGCDSLTTAPTKLPATTLAENCYDSMFHSCKKLTTAPELPATTLAKYCYDNMFYGCDSLTTAPELPSTELVAGCYRGMFNSCINLIEAPVLPAETLVYNCYVSMFAGCSNLNYLKCYATGSNASIANCVSGWMTNAGKNQTNCRFYGKLDDLVDYIPSNWETYYISDDN